MTDLIRIFTERGDLAHLALLLWAMSATALGWFALRELTAASRRFDDFVRELARFNELSETLMETFIAVLRSVHRERKSARPSDIFREFLDHLGRSVRRGDEGEGATA